MEKGSVLRLYSDTEKGTLNVMRIKKLPFRWFVLLNVDHYYFEGGITSFHC